MERFSCLEFVPVFCDCFLCRNSNDAEETLMLSNAAEVEVHG